MPNVGAGTAWLCEPCAAGPVTGAVILAALCDLLRGVMLVGLPVSLWLAAQMLYRDGMAGAVALCVRGLYVGALVR
jgi:hypothetical protein